jgi:hypothetical protein
MLILYSFGIDFLEEEFHGWHGAPAYYLAQFCRINTSRSKKSVPRQPRRRNDGYEVSVVYYPSFVVTILGGTLLWDGQFSVESCWNAPRFFSHRV